WVLGGPPVEVSADETALQARWADGSRLEGCYEEGPLHDRVEVTAGAAAVVLDRARRSRLVGKGVRLGAARWPHPGLARARLGRSGWERAFEWALDSFVGACRGGPLT